MFFIIAVHLFFSSLYAIGMRSFAKKRSVKQGRAVMPIILLFGAAPIVWIVALATGKFNPDLSASQFLLLIVAACFFSIGNTLIYQASNRVDAAQGAVLQNIQVVWVMMLAVSILDESFNFNKIVAIVLIIVAGSLTAIEKIDKKTFKFDKNSLYPIAVGLAFGTGQVIEKKLSLELGPETYLPLIWLVTPIIMFAFGFKKIQANKELFKPKTFLKLWLLGACVAATGASYVIGVKMSGSVGLMASAQSYRSVIIFLAGWLFLKERKHPIPRLIASVLATLGLYLLVK